MKGHQACFILFFAPFVISTISRWWYLMIYKYLANIFDAFTRDV